MSNYAVTWSTECESQLMALWIRALNREAVAGYAEQIDRILARDPNEQGESRERNMRIAFFRPLSVQFQIDESAKSVVVLAIKWVGR